MHFDLFTVQTSGCMKRIQINPNDLRSYTQALVSPFYDDDGRQSVSCLHTFEGIPSKAFVSVSLHNAYGLVYPGYYQESEVTTLTVSNDTASQNFTSSSDLVFLQSYTGITFNITSREDDSWSFVYMLKGKCKTKCISKTFL